MAHETNEHEQWMRRAIRLAMNGRGRVEPNPMVGCVIVKDGRVIGEGYHEQYGGPHAEPNALAACAESPQGATVYTTLEPCCHTNKKTPPCVPRLIAAKVGRIVVGCIDPDPDVNGRGVGQLRTAGIEVAAPVLEAECKQLLAPFIARVVHKRPYVTLKWAETADGKIAGPEGKRLFITGEESNRHVHELRARCDAIVVGGRTLRNDDPQLTVRHATPLRPLLRVVFSALLRVPLDSFLVRTAKEFPTVVYTPQRRKDEAPADVAALEERGVSVVGTGSNLWLAIPDVLADLSRRGVTHLLAESGGMVAKLFVQTGHADRVWVFKSDRVTAGANGIPAERTAAYIPTGGLHLGDDTLTEWLNPSGPLFYTGQPSADFVLAREAGAAGSDGRV